MDQKKFQALQSKWYKKLAVSGFEDIEDSQGRLIMWTQNTSTATSPEASAEYFRWAQQCVHDMKFPSKLDKQIWMAHAAGLSLREVAKYIGKSKTSIEYRLKKLHRTLKQP